MDAPALQTETGIKSCLSASLRTLQRREFLSRRSRPQLCWSEWSGRLCPPSSFRHQTHLCPNLFQSLQVSFAVRRSANFLLKIRLQRICRPVNRRWVWSRLRRHTQRFHLEMMRIELETSSGRLCFGCLKRRVQPLSASNVMEGVIVFPPPRQTVASTDQTPGRPKTTPMRLDWPKPLICLGGAAHASRP